MNDRFKFRAWDKTENAYIEDAQFTYDDGCEGGVGSFRHYSFRDLLEDKNCIVEQCTGLKDRNQKLIYEGVTRPTDLFSPMDYEWLDLIRDELGYLIRCGEWRDTVYNGYFTVEEHKKRYSFEDIAPDFMCLSDNTIFIKDKQERVIAAIIPEKHIENDYFRIKDDCLIIKKKQLIGSKILFQYRSTCVAWDYDDFEEKTILDKNTDVPIFDEYLVKLGVLWRYERYKGVDYGETLSEYTRELKKRFAMN